MVMIVASHSLSAAPMTALATRTALPQLDVDPQHIRGIVEQLQKQHAKQQEQIPQLEANIAAWTREVNSLTSYQHIQRCRELRERIRTAEHYVTRLKNPAHVNQFITQAQRLEQYVVDMHKQQHAETIQQTEKVFAQLQGVREEDEDDEEEAEQANLQEPDAEATDQQACETDKRKRTRHGTKRAAKKAKQTVQEPHVATVIEPRATRKRGVSRPADPASPQITETRTTKRSKSAVEESGPDTSHSASQEFDTNGANTFHNPFRAPHGHRQSTQVKTEPQVKSATEVEDEDTRARMAAYQESFKLAESLNLLEHKRSIPAYAPVDHCRTCNELLLLKQTEAQLVCPKCARVYRHSDTTASALGYGNEIEQSKYAYDRMTHLLQVLQRFDYRPTLEIEDKEQVLDDVRSVIRLDRFPKHHDYTPAKVRQILRLLRRNDLYKHAHALTEELNNVKWPVMTLDERWNIILVFLQASDAFDRLKRLGYFAHLHEQRTSFLHYQYTAHKICELLGYTKFLPFLRLLKTKSKLCAQEECWRMICAYLGYHFSHSM